jgi:glycosyltransferase involved in cell wall biosynthesis
MLQHADGSGCDGPAAASCIACVMGAGGRPPALPRWERIWCKLRAIAGDVPAAGPEANRERFRALQDALDSYDRVLADSQYVLEEYARQGMQLNRALALPLGIDCGAFGAPKEVPPLPISNHRPLRLAFVGQFLLHKGPQVLLEALRRVPELPIRLELHGRRWPDHADEAVLGPLLLAEPRAVHRGRFADGALPALLAGIDVLVVPSTCPETFGLATREAHLAARPVVSSDRGALPESVRDGEDGLIVPGDDPDVMADALSRLVAEPGLLERLLAGARRARDRVKSMEVYAAEVEREAYAP